METLIYRITGICLIIAGGFFHGVGGISYAGLNLSFASFLAGIGICIFLFPPSKEVTIKNVLDKIPFGKKDGEK